MLYSTARDGVSLNTLFRANEAAGGTGPALMLICDDGGGVFGRGLHSSTFQLNLNRFGHTSLCPPV